MPSLHTPALPLRAAGGCRDGFVMPWRECLRARAAPRGLGEALCGGRHVEGDAAWVATGVPGLAWPHYRAGEVPHT